MILTKLTRLYWCDVLVLKRGPSTILRDDFVSTKDITFFTLIHSFDMCTCTIFFFE